MTMVQVGFAAGALLGAGVLTALLVWVLKKFLTPLLAIWLGNGASFALASCLYSGGPVEGATIYAIPQAVWLLVTLGTHLKRKANAARASNEGGARVEPTFGNTSVEIQPLPVPSEQALPSLEPTSLLLRQPKSRSRWNFVLNHWRGLYSLGVSYWLFGLLVSTLAAAVTPALNALFADDDGYEPKKIFFLLCSIWVTLTATTLWQTVGVWRSAKRTSVGKPSPWAGLAQIMVALAAMRFIVVLGTNATPQLSESYRQGFMGDPEIPAYSLRLMRNGTEVEVTGGFKYGLTDDFKRIYSASPQIKIVHLNSPGGRVGEALKLNKLFRTAGFVTYVSSECASACTVAFAGGKERWLYSNARLGFHSATLPGLDQREVASLNIEQSEVMISSGYDSQFVRSALAVPSKSIWYPTFDQLKNAHVITSVSNGTQFATSGYGGNIPKSAFIEPLSTNVPILGALRQRDEPVFSRVVDAYFRGYVEGKSEEEQNQLIRYVAFAEVRKMLPSTSDEAIVAYGSLLVSEVEELAPLQPAQCAKFASTGGGDADIQLSLNRGSLLRFQEIGKQVILASTEAKVDDKVRLSSDLKAVFSRLRASKPSLHVNLLSSEPTAGQAADYCAAALGMYIEMLNAPTSGAASMLRMMVKGR